MWINIVNVLENPPQVLWFIQDGVQDGRQRIVIFNK